MFGKRTLLVAFGLTALATTSRAAILYSTPPASSGLNAYTTEITVNADGSTTTSKPANSAAFGGEDSFIHVINNSAVTISGFTLSGNDIFGFDQDGTLDNGAFIDPGDYSGTLVSFTYNPLVSTDTGSVNFIGGLAPNSDLYFELEEDVTAAGSGFTVGPVNPVGPVGVPEPATLALLGTGLFALVGAKARRRNG